MAEKFVPSAEDFFNSIKAETSLDFVKQRAAMINAF